jgi:hypothetical protein
MMPTECGQRSNNMEKRRYLGVPVLKSRKTNSSVRAKPGCYSLRIGRHVLPRDGALPKYLKT